MKKYVELEDVIQRLDNAIYETNRGAMGYDEALKRLRIAYAETMPTIEVNGIYITNLNKDKVRKCLMEYYPLDEDEVVDFQVIETPTCSECDHYEDHHTSLACANCPVITKVWGGIFNE